MRGAALAAIAMLLASPALAGNLRLQSPIDCTPGIDCFIQQYMDHDPGLGAYDHRCGTLTYNGHDGTDFALPHFSDLGRKVVVRAAAGGRVVGARDGVPDQVFTPDRSAEIAGRECGNGVVIQHFDGWETQYCHLRNGSVTVQTGDEVIVGDKLGEVGLSGQTEFPHLHFSVRYGGVHINPFAPTSNNTCSADFQERTLWIDPPAYQAGGILSLGFSEDLPDFDRIKAGTPFAASLPTDASAIVLHGYAFGGREGDKIHLFLSGPPGTVIDHTDTLSGDQALFFRAAGTRLRGKTWPTGTYDARVAIERNGHLLDLRKGTLEIR